MDIVNLLVGGMLLCVIPLIILILIHDNLQDSNLEIPNWLEKVMLILICYCTSVIGIVVILGIIENPGYLLGIGFVVILIAMFKIIDWIIGGIIKVGGKYESRKRK